MRVFELTFDTEYQSITTEDTESLFDVASKMRMNKPIGKFIFPKFYVFSQKKSIGNFYYMQWGMLVFDDLAHQSLSSEIQAAGEIYEISVDGAGTLYALNVIESCDALDHERSVWRDEEDGEKYVLLEFAFKPNRISARSGLFRIAEDRFTRLFAVTGMPGQLGDFYTRYQETGLTGLTFTEVWSDQIA